MGCPALNSVALNNVEFNVVGGSNMVDSQAKDHECKENVSDVSDGIELKERINKKSSLSLQTEPSPQTQISKYNQKSLV